MGNSTRPSNRRLQPDASFNRVIHEPRRSQLPIPLTGFVGRDQEIAYVVDALRRPEVRLVSLTGPGGVGKTRLALRVATDAANAFPDGIWFAPLTLVRDPALVSASIAQSLGVREVGTRTIEESLSEFLSDRQALLILDNFEHVLAAAPLVADLLAANPALTIMATSRAVLRISGEHDIEIPPMRVPSPDRQADMEAVAPFDAVQLFVARAQAAASDFALTDATATAVVEVCRRLDGLPLAIELAAARVKHLRLSLLWQRLEQRLPFLVGGPRDQPERLQTMRNAVAWSYDLLTATERAVFCRLAVFEGGSTLEATEAVAGEGDVDTLQVVSSLTDQSLLRCEDGPDGIPRYLMLETIREYAREQLSANGEAPATRDRHAAWFLQLADASEEATPGGPDQAHWLAQLATELPNLRAALSWLEESGDIEAMMRFAGALGGFWFWGSHRREGAAWLERALAAADEEPTPGRGKALLVLGFQGMEQGHSRAAEYAAESVAVWTALGDARGVANARLALGQILEYRADYKRAVPLLEQAAAEWDVLGEPSRAAVALYFLGQAAFDHEDGQRAKALFDEALERFRRGGYAWGVSGSLHQLGEVATMQGDTATAAAYYASSMDGTGSRENLVGKLVAIGRLAATGGHAETAARVLGAAAGLADAIGYVRRLPEQRRLDRDAAIARTALGDADFSRSWAAGMALPTEDAVKEAMDVLATLRAPVNPEADDPAAMLIAILTSREREVLALMCAHLQDREIAERLFLSPRTVESHVSHILGKFGVSSRREVVALATRHDLVVGPRI